MSVIAKKKQQNINRELILGTGAIALIFPMMFSAITFSVIGVAFGILLLLGSNDVPTTSAMTMVLVYGSVLLIFAFSLRLFIKRFYTLLNRKRALENEHQRVADILDTSGAVGRLAQHDTHQTDDIVTADHLVIKTASNDI